VNSYYQEALVSLKVLEHWLITHDISIRNDQDETALHSASRNGHLEVVKLLMKSGAKLDDINVKFQTTLDVAKETNRDTVVDAVLLQSRHDHVFIYLSSLEAFQQIESLEKEVKEKQQIIHELTQEIERLKQAKLI
jgi:ankyrin repeat protein